MSTFNSGPTNGPAQNGALRSHREIFHAVLRSYREIFEYQPLTACNIDPQRPAAMRKLSANAIHLKIDIERATELALANEPELQRVWFAMLTGETSDSRLAREVVTRCGRVYAERELAPWRYFKRRAA